MSAEEDTGSAMERDEAVSAQESWFARHTEGEAKKDVLPLSERAGAVVGFIVILLVLWFWLVHQTSATGFFTSAFGPAEAFLFYLSLLFSLVPTTVTLQRGAARSSAQQQLLNMVLIVVAFSWLLWVFPFNFAHLADVLPESIRFLLQWISDDVARVIMTIAIIGTAIGIVYTAVLYVFVRRELARPKKGRGPMSHSGDVAFGTRR